MTVPLQQTAHDTRPSWVRVSHPRHIHVTPANHPSGNWIQIRILKKNTTESLGESCVHTDSRHLRPLLQETSLIQKKKNKKTSCWQNQNVRQDQDLHEQ